MRIREQDKWRVDEFSVGTWRAVGQDRMDWARLLKMFDEMKAGGRKELLRNREETRKGGTRT